MRTSARVAIASLLVVAAAAAVDATASGYRHVSDFEWVDSGQALALRSDNDSGVVVTRAEPAPFHGLQRGDVILAVDGRPVRQVEEVMRALTGRTTPLALRVRHGTIETTLVWSRADYRAFAPAVPAAPPPPPHN